MKKKVIESEFNQVSHVSNQTLHEEGEPYLDNDGEVCATIYDTECRICDLVKSQVAAAKKLLAQVEEEPSIDLGIHCHKPYDCAFWQYCSQHLPKKSVFNLYRMNFGKKIEHYLQGIITYEQLRAEDLNEKQRMQVECNLGDTIYTPVRDKDS